MDEMTTLIHSVPKDKEAFVNSFGPGSWRDLCNDVAVSVSMGGTWVTNKKVAEIVIEIAEAEGMADRVPQEIRNWLLVEKSMSDDDAYRHRLGV